MEKENMRGLTKDSREETLTQALDKHSNEVLLKAEELKTKTEECYNDLFNSVKDKTEDEDRSLNDPAWESKFHNRLNTVHIIIVDALHLLNRFY